MNDTDITKATARILQLIRSETPRLNPTSEDFDIECMFTKVLP